MDAAVLLTPILMLAVLLLLGYAGCLDPPPPAPPRLCIRVRVPAALVVTEVAVRMVRPGGETTLETAANPIPESTQGGDNVFRLDDGELQIGTWTVACRVTVVENGATAAAPAQGTFVLDGTYEAPCADFQASGSPSGGDFAVAFVGLT